MRVQDVLVGMEVEYNSKSYQIVKIENNLAFIKGEFIPNTTIKCTIEFPIESLFHSNTSFKLKECPKHGEEILVSNNGNSWYIRTFDGYGKQPGSVITIFQSSDMDIPNEVEVHYGSDGFSENEIVEWKMFKRITLIK